MIIRRALGRDHGDDMTIVGGDYGSILLIREIDDHARRGYLFEQAIRELVPWDHRPPLPVSGTSEQLDAFFEWNSWHFLVEAKAKRGEILRGSHDWEDFEPKVRKRKGVCIGLFMSLFDVSPGVVEAAVDLNKESMTSIVLAGSFWDDACNSGVPIAEILRYMVAHARAKQLAVPPPLSVVEKYVYDLQLVSTQVEDVCRTASAVFLRRHKLERHEDLYVQRQIDRSLAGLAAAVKPTALTSIARERTHEDLTYTTARTMPSQIYVIRDASGAGKTTQSVQIALSTDPFFGIARAAVEPSLDSLPELLGRLGDSCGLPEAAQNQPPRDHGGRLAR